ncbi:MAG: type II secretion system protein [Desulfobacterales bacterium]|nr:type II secretion system protein [Desulfobacterales bacterium]
MKRNLKNNSGFTLLELLVSIALMGVIVVGLDQVLHTAISAYDNTKEKQELLIQARFALDRISLFIQESDSIVSPSDTGQEVIKVSERLLDTYNNTTRAYVSAGDGLLDADNNFNGRVNDDITTDPADYIIFDLDKTDASNWKLQEKTPDYSTCCTALLLADFAAPIVLCENVTAFSSSRLAANLVEIALTLTRGKSQVALKTRVRARLIE